MKLKTKITLSTLATVLTIFIIAMGINTFIFYNQAKGFRDKEINSAISFFLSEINNATKKTEIVGQDLAQSGEIIYNVKSKENPKKTLSTLLLKKIKNFPNLVGGGIWYEPSVLKEKYMGPYALWKNNKVVVTWEYSNESYNYLKQKWYALALPEKWNREIPRPETHYRTPPYIDNLGNEKVIFITLCTIMYDKSQKIIGMSTIDWTLKSIKKLLSKLDITKSSFAVLIDKESHKILFHPDEKYLLKEYKELLWLQNNDLPSVNKNDIIIEDNVKINGSDYIIYFTETESGFFLVVAINKKEAYAVIGEILLRNSILTIITLLVIGIVISLIVGKSIQPLMDIIEILRGIASGKKSLHERIKIKSRDEFGELANTYNSMADTIERQNNEIKEYTEHLEDKVKERTNELNLSLEEVTKLKNQQDGDYFLTSLLLKPLGSKNIKSDKVKVDFLVKQKKEFEFKRNKNEIGGDLCTADTITLGNKDYSVFLNADAMGKSIQGAGGALIIGSVFHAIVERTKFSKQLSDSYTPERWIKNTFIELHKTFETFEGSMLVSIILGLVDNETGYCYFINAEHPFAVLYRDGIASFIETKLMFHKLGMNIDSDSTIYVRTFQLLRGDIIVIGSDGKDDLNIGKDDTGQRIMNEDENEFLRRVEEGKSDLVEIANAIKKAGEITDDLSLLRLEYIGEGKQNQSLSVVEKKVIHSARKFLKLGKNQNAVEVLEEANEHNPNQPDIIREMMKVYLKTKSYIKVSKLVIPYLRMKPDDVDMIYLASYTFRKLKKFELSLDYAEQLKIRDPENISYRMNLAEIYAMMGNSKKAEEIVEYIKKVDDKNTKLIKLIELIKRKKTATTN